ncbi:MAG: HAD family hydrolase [Clostridia bacterium]|nr:HAD family hydrolase [Clostridia bacterium]
MIKAVLFDLDGTLLPIDTDEFLQQYMAALGKKVSHIMDTEDFIKQLLESTMEMIMDDNMEHKNHEVFWKHFTDKLGEKTVELTPLIEDFYHRDFPKLGEGIQPRRIAAELIEVVKNKKLKLVLATNAVFPRTAIEERIRWASIDPGDFDLITTYENMHYCKPHLGYYREIANKIHVQPQHCLMVGNDIKEDMIAGELGMKTFLLEDYIIGSIDDKEGAKYIHHRGNLNQLHSHLKNI